MAAVEWVVDPRKFIPEFKGKIAAITEEVAIEIFAGVISRTPVRTGNLRASWRIKEGSVDDSITESGSVESPAPAPKIPSKISFSTEYPTIYVTNYQPYAGFVNNGTPHHPPVSMVELTLASLKSK